MSIYSFWVVSCLQICPELSGERKGGKRCRLFVEKERNCQSNMVWLSMVEYGVRVVERNCHLSTTGKMVYGGSAKSGRRDNVMSRTTTGYEDKQTQRGYTSCIFSTNCLTFLKDKGISGDLYLEVQLQGYHIAITARSLTGRLEY